jgi:adenylylsulfate kinase-like enzyme
MAAGASDNPGHGFCPPARASAASAARATGGEHLVTPDLPVLWLCGPPGIGKSAVGWEIFSELARAGIEASYVDIDQLGMCYPEPASDPGRHRMQAQNLGAVISGFRAAGAWCVVVSGVVDPARGVQADEIPQVALTVCRLRAGPDELRQRFSARGGRAEDIAEVLREAAEVDASDFADVCIDTSGASVADVAGLVRRRCGGWPDRTGAGRTGAGRSSGLIEPERRLRAAAPPILWICGATGVGKSTVGFEIYQRQLRTGMTAAYVDLDQVGFCRPATGDPRNHRLKARNLAGLWQTYRAAGAQCLTVVGPVEDEVAVSAYTGVLPSATVTLCRLHAGRNQLASRIMLRGQGGSWHQPGDPLIGQSPAHLRRIADNATADADALERAAIGDLRIDTDQCTVEDAAELIVAQTLAVRLPARGGPACVQHAGGPWARSRSQRSPSKRRELAEWCR